MLKEILGVFLSMVPEKELKKLFKEFNLLHMTVLSLNLKKAKFSTRVS
jgi:hypothetical protein